MSTLPAMVMRKSCPRRRSSSGPSCVATRSTVVQGSATRYHDEPFSRRGWVMQDSPRVTLTAISKSDDGEVGCFGRGRCCKNNPGWFGPGEMEQAAELLGMEPEAFFRK